MNLGEKLLKLRKLKGLSQEEAADKLNVTRQTVSKWETNQSTPDFDKLIPICKLYEIGTEELLTGNKKEVKNKIGEDALDKPNKKKYALGISLGVLIYFISIVWIMITIPVMKLNPIVSSAVFIIICGIATFIIVYSSMVYKKKEVKYESKEEKSIKNINEILSILFTIIYFVISFITMAWHITWIIWIVYALLTQIVKLVFMLKGDNYEK